MLWVIFSHSGRTWLPGNDLLMTPGHWNEHWHRGVTVHLVCPGKALSWFSPFRPWDWLWLEFHREHKSFLCLLKVRPVTRPFHLLELWSPSHGLATHSRALRNTSSSCSWWPYGFRRKTRFFARHQVCVWFPALPPVFTGPGTQDVLVEWMIQEAQDSSKPEVSHNQWMEKSHRLPKTNSFSGFEF
jgi:hypothetical protein